MDIVDLFRPGILNNIPKAARAGTLLCALLRPLPARLVRACPVSCDSIRPDWAPVPVTRAQSCGAPRQSTPRSSQAQKRVPRRELRAPDAPPHPIPDIARLAFTVTSSARRARRCAQCGLPASRDAPKLEKYLHLRVGWRAVACARAVNAAFGLTKTIDGND